MDEDKDFLIAALTESNELLQEDNARFRRTNALMRKINGILRAKLEIAAKNDEEFRNAEFGDSADVVVEGGLPENDLVGV